jgi:putative tricarboxylic transport membrane protein
MSSNLIVGAAACIIGVIYTVQAFYLPKAPIGDPLSPIYFPAALGIIMLICGLGLLLTEIKKGVYRNKEKGKTHRKNKKTITLITLTVAFGLIYAFIFERFGFVISTTLFLGAIFFLINGKRKWTINIIVSLVFSGSIWYVFGKLLGISLP